MIDTYRDANRSVEERVEDLLSRMTLEEKIGQMMQLDGRRDTAPDEIRAMHIGSVLGVLEEDITRLQRVALESRLGIPLLIGIDAIHGHSFQHGATIFPTQLAMSCAWNESLAEQAARITAIEASYTGVHWTFSPVFCLPRDLRWGRVNETFGEDPLLIGRLGAAMVRGYQGDDLADPRALAACAKHYAGYGDTLGGRDASEGEHSRRKMRTYFLPPFEAAIQAGVATFMTGYQSVDGVPCTANRWLLTDVLRTEWGFDGVVVTDWNTVGDLHTMHAISPTLSDAAIKAVHAGNDMMMSTPGFFQAAIDAVQSGTLPLAEIDEATRRVLRLKFRLGLFENPRLPDMERGQKVIGCPEHHAVARQIAREGTVLLKNSGVLPLDMAKIKRIAVIGPIADDDITQLGDWSLGASAHAHGRMARQPRAATVTVLDGIRQRFGQEAEIRFAEGCGIGIAKTEKIAHAVQVAKEADLAVLVLGDDGTYMGERLSTATLELMGGQHALFNAVTATGVPVVVIFIASKPLAIPQVVEHADALLCAFNPGMDGGTAIAEILAGDINPSGKLTISFPYHVGQQPVSYHAPRQVHGDSHPDIPGVGFQPLFAFGFGLSYTKFRYKRLRLAAQEITAGQPVIAEIDVTNIGEREGTEIVQCYLHDKFTSATWPEKLLKDYLRVTLKSGETATVRFTIPYDQLAIVDAECRRVVEPGDFVLLVGSSSRNVDLHRADFSVMA